MAEGHEIPSLGLPEDPLALAVEELSQARSNFFEATSQYANWPSEKNYSHLIKTTKASYYSFKGTVETVLDAEGYEASQRAHILATLFAEDDTSRIKHFRQLAPAGDFIEDPSTQGVFVSQVEKVFQDDTDKAIILEGLMHHYTRGLRVDLAELCDPSSLDHKAQVRWLAAKAGAHVLDVAKVTLGVVAGAWLVRKKFDRNS